MIKDASKPKPNPSPIRIRFPLYGLHYLSPTDPTGFSLLLLLLMGFCVGILCWWCEWSPILRTTVKWNNLTIISYRTVVVLYWRTLSLFLNTVVSYRIVSFTVLDHFCSWTFVVPKLLYRIWYCSELRATVLYSKTSPNKIQTQTRTRTHYGRE